MADRRADDRPLAPPRPLSGPTAEQRDGGRPVSERVPAAVPAGGSSAERSGTSTAGATAPRAGQPAQSGTPQPRPRGTRRARLRVPHVDPSSVMKTAFLLSLALGIVTVVAVAVVWSVLSAAGVWDSINKTVTDVMGGDSAQNFDVKNYVGTSRVLGFTMIVAVVDVVLITAISTLGAFLYNLSAALLGGVEVTLAEDER